MIRRLFFLLPLLLAGALRADDWKALAVPGAWESAAPGYDGVAWYRAWVWPHAEFFTPHERNLFEESVSLTLPDVADAHEAPRAVHREAPGEPVIQFSLSLRKSLRKELARMAADTDMTMRAFVLNALKEKGLPVRDDDLADLRKK